MLQRIQEIVIILNTTFELQDLLEKILDLCIYYTPATSNSILLVDDNKREFFLKAYRGNGDARELKGVHFDINEGISGLAYQKCEIVYVEDVANSPRYKKLRPEVQSEVAIPLKYKGEVFGVLCLDSHQKFAFGKAQLQFFELLAVIAAQAINNVRSYSAVKTTNKLNNILIQVGHILTEGMDLEYLFRKIMNLLGQELQIQVGILNLLEKEKETLNIEVSWGLTEEEKDRGSYHLGEGITGLVAQQGKTIGVPDIRDADAFASKTGFVARLDQDKRYCFICAPLIIGSKVLGALSITKEYINDDNYKADLRFTEMISSSIAKTVYIHLLFREEKLKLEAENQALRDRLQTRYHFQNIIANSSKMKKMLEMVEQIADSNATVMVRGESGTGKELIANAIHYNSPRRKNAFIKINCAALPDTLLESELFGHVKGAFTGAYRDKQGKFLQADGGTIFLDEIGDTSPLMQVKLLRVLQEKEFEPIGSEKTVKIDVRILAATNKNLEEAVEKGEFRQDLYYRLNVVPLLIPPLRERREDIAFLADHFMRKYNQENGKAIRGLDPHALKVLTNYDWPGNVRELENIIEYGIVIEQGPYITLSSLQLPNKKQYELPMTFHEIIQEKELTLEASSISAISPKSPVKLKQIMEQFEKGILKQALDQFEQNRSVTARHLGINRVSLINKIKKYRL